MTGSSRSSLPGRERKRKKTVSSSPRSGRASSGLEPNPFATQILGSHMRPVRVAVGVSPGWIYWARHLDSWPEQLPVSAFISHRGTVFICFDVAGRPVVFIQSILLFTCCWAGTIDSADWPKRFGTAPTICPVHRRRRRRHLPIRVPRPQPSTAGEILLSASQPPSYVYLRFPRNNLKGAGAGGVDFILQLGQEDDQFLFALEADSKRS